jgi:hypothetical protein
LGDLLRFICEIVRFQTTSTPTITATIDTTANSTITSNSTDDQQAAVAALHERAAVVDAHDEQLHDDHGG